MSWHHTVASLFLQQGQGRCWELLNRWIKINTDQSRKKKLSEQKHMGSATMQWFRSEAVNGIVRSRQSQDLNLTL